ncbi:MAG: alanine:cation symporter family protein [Faecalibacterium prausnitzii]
MLAREEQAISQFQSLCTALASTIGTGNLVGVSTAILSGGAGAVFWMWVMALLGMMTSYAENVLGIYYRRKDPAGGWRGGPMYYLRDGLGGKPGRVLAVLFAAFCALRKLWHRQPEPAQFHRGQPESGFWRAGSPSPAQCWRQCRQ